MTLHMKLIITAFALLPLAACTSPDTFEVGSSVDEGGYGAPTLNNQLAMMSEGNATQILSERFARQVNPTINFAFNSSELSPEAAATLSRQAAWIKQFPEVRFSVYGYTDRVGTEHYNKGLGLRRARAAVAYLIAQGISGSRLQALVSYGETRPVVNTPGPEVLNRRAVTGVSGFSRGYSGMLNGKYAAVIMREYIDSAVRIHPTNTDVKSSTETAK